MISRNIFRFPGIDLQLFEEKMLRWSTSFSCAAFYNSNNWNQNSSFNKLFGIGCLAAFELHHSEQMDDCRQFINQNTDWRFLAISYDYKNVFVSNYAKVAAEIQFPKICVFIPEFVFHVQTEIILETYLSEFEATKLIEHILNFENEISLSHEIVSDIRASIDKQTYLNTVKIILDHIQKGDFYEINFCFPFSTKVESLSITSLYKQLNAKSEAPFSGIFKWNDFSVVSSSPERFLKKCTNRLISQPIKGTARRASNSLLDNQIKQELQNNEKERAENVMIVDLVRNDLSKIAEKASVAVDSLCEIHSFKQVHQMISTISCTVRKEVDFFDILDATFPMGSMTGAPKVEAMKWIDQYEPAARGMYSGSFGYITPNNDFDLNVIIRSLLCDTKTGKVTFSVGSAITANAVAEAEFEECLLKAKAMIEVLKSQLFEQPAL